MVGGRLGTARVGILTIIEEEFEAVRAALRGWGDVVEVVESSYYSPDPSSCDVVLAQSTDRSNIPASNAARSILEDFHPEVLIVCGIAGGFEGRSLRLGDVVVADYLHYCEFWKLTEGGNFRRYLPIEQPSPHLRATHVRPLARDLVLADRLDLDAPEQGHGLRPKVVEGSIVVGEKEMGNPKHEAQRLAAGAYDNALAVDMESAGVASALSEARRRVDYNPLLLVIRGVSDILRAVDPDVSETDQERREAEQDNSAQRQSWRGFAATTAAGFCGALVERLLRQPDLRHTIRESSSPVRADSMASGIEARPVPQASRARNPDIHAAASLGLEAVPPAGDRLRRTADPRTAE